VQCPDADFILVIARALPSFLLTLVDTGIFYSVRTWSVIHARSVHSDNPLLLAQAAQDPVLPLITASDAAPSPGRSPWQW